MQRGLIIVDVQNDYFSGGTMELRGMAAAADNCRRLLDDFRQRGAPLFHVQHLATRPGATFFVPGTVGAEINDRVTPLANETVISKNFPSAFRATELQQKLQADGVDTLVICGAMTHMCIDTTVRAAFDLGYRCELIADACATRDLEFGGRKLAAADVHAAFMAALSSPFARIDDTDSWLAADES